MKSIKIIVISILCWCALGCLQYRPQAWYYQPQPQLQPQIQVRTVPNYRDNNYWQQKLNEHLNK